jgi:WD40 repeat protein
MAVLQASAGTPLALAFSPDERTLAAGCDDGSVRFWRYPELAFLGTLEWHVGPVHSLAFSPDGEWLASAGADGYVRLWPWRRLLELP